MKKFTLIAIAAIALLAFKTKEDNQPQKATILDTCKSSETKKKCKKLLDPYTYDASKSTRITFKNKPQMKELEIPLYMGEKYRFIFSKEGLPQDVDITIWDHKYESKKRKKLFSTKDFPEDQKDFSWEPEKSKKMYIDYAIPQTNDTIKKGCVVMVLGYLSKVDK